MNASRDSMKPIILKFLGNNNDLFEIFYGNYIFENKK
jgi:hypothetical protein